MVGAFMKRKETEWLLFKSRKWSEFLEDFTCFHDNTSVSTTVMYRSLSAVMIIPKIAASYFVMYTNDLTTASSVLLGSNEGNSHCNCWVIKLWFVEPGEIHVRRRKISINWKGRECPGTYLAHRRSFGKLIRFLETVTKALLNVNLSSLQHVRNRDLVLGTRTSIQRTTAHLH